MGGDSFSISFDAKHLVKRMKRVLGIDVEYFDTYGIIIASTLSGRTGLFHFEALQVAETAADWTFSREKPVKTAQEIFLPVKEDHRTYGVLGLIGQPEKLISLSQVALHLVRELTDFESTDKSERAYFLHEWILAAQPADEKVLMQRGQSVGVNASLSYCVLALQPHSPADDSFQTHIRRLMSANSKLRFDIGAIPNCYSLQEAQHTFILLEKGCALASYPAVTAWIDSIEAFTGVRFFGGMDENFFSGADVPSGARNAKNAMSYAMFRQKQATDICRYSELFWNTFMADIPKNYRLDVVYRLFQDMSPDEIDSAFIMLRQLYDADLAVGTVASRMHIHPNTLRYRLGKLEDVTGVNPRCCEGIARYTAAYNFWLSVFPEKWGVYNATIQGMDERFYRE